MAVRIALFLIGVGVSWAVFGGVRCYVNRDKDGLEQELHEKAGWAKPVSFTLLVMAFYLLWFVVSFYLMDWPVISVVQAVLLPVIWWGAERTAGILLGVKNGNAGNADSAEEPENTEAAADGEGGIAAESIDIEKAETPAVEGVVEETSEVTAAEDTDEEKSEDSGTGSIDEEKAEAEEPAAEDIDGKKSEVPAGNRKGYRRISFFAFAGMVIGGVIAFAGSGESRTFLQLLGFALAILIGVYFISGRKEKARKGKEIFTGIWEDFKGIVVVSDQEDVTGKQAVEEFVGITVVYLLVLLLFRFVHGLRAVIIGFVIGLLIFFYCAYRRNKKKVG